MQVTCPHFLERQVQGEYTVHTYAKLCGSERLYQPQFLCTGMHFAFRLFNSRGNTKEYGSFIGFITGSKHVANIILIINYG